MSLRLYTNGYETCVAESPADARALYCAHVGESPDDPLFSPIEGWRERPGEKLAIVDRDTGDVVFRDATEWIAGGARFLCSTEY